MSSFEKGTREKVRFNLKVSRKGSVPVMLNASIEDLWDISLDDLNTAGIAINKELRESSEISFIKAKTSTNTLLELKLDIIKHIINVKLEEEEAKKLAKERRAKKEQIMELIARKKLEVMGGKSVAELEKELLELDA